MYLVVKKIPEHENGIGAEPSNSALPIKKLNFGHTPETIEFWKRLVRETLSLSTQTPFYLCSALPIRRKNFRTSTTPSCAPGFNRQPAIRKSVIIRHWLSLQKLQPVAPLLRWWRAQGRPIEVVSEFELRAALAAGFAPENILANGPAKQYWLPQFALRGLSVNLDSPAELAVLLPLAKKTGLASRHPHFNQRRI